MKKIYLYIPNTLTCLNLACGFYATAAGMQGHFLYAMTAVFLAAVFDFADGFAARMLKAYSPIGKELDSLSDIVSFGVAPGAMLYSFLDGMADGGSFGSRAFLLSAFFIPVFSGLRLAKFNIDSRQTKSFLGLPVPAHAIFWAPLVYSLSCSPLSFTPLSCTLPCTLFGGEAIIISPVILMGCLSALAIVSSSLLVTEIPMFSLKMSSLRWKDNKLQYVLLASAILLIVFFGFAGVSATALLYVLMSILAYRGVES
ncbi:MAG: CDP-alcohol phosphatidyltransferase family protein [Tannerella sp.]|jgi:CDP-diacylglycerol--serine O-phosphatidyltransferase|nr:CDP-alcohol phosphatidyltransferase family protein [Tannerella sp.]